MLAQHLAVQKGRIGARSAGARSCRRKQQPRVAVLLYRVTGKMNRRRSFEERNDLGLGRLGAQQQGRVLR